MPDALLRKVSCYLRILKLPTVVRVKHLRLGALEELFKAFDHGWAVVLTSRDTADLAREDVNARNDILEPLVGFRIFKDLKAGNVALPALIHGSCGHCAFVFFACGRPG